MNKEIKQFFIRHRFGSINPVMSFLSLLPIQDRIDLLNSLLEGDNTNVNIYDKLSMAYLKNGEQMKATTLLSDAYKSGLLSDLHFSQLREKILSLSNRTEFGSITSYQQSINRLKEELQQEDSQKIYSMMGIQKECNDFLHLLINYCKSKMPGYTE